jgi:superkiller protein 3
LIALIEAEEKEKINKEIGNRRSRLGSTYDQVVLDVKREVLGASPVR